MKTTAIAILIILSSNALAQKTKYIDLGLGFAKNEQIFTTGYYKNWNLGKSNKKSKKVFIGTGVRFFGFFGKSTFFTSAPPSLYGTVNEDSLFAPKPALYAINTFINFGFDISTALQVGFNLDVVGFSFGPTGSPSFITNGNSTTTKASPTKLNALLISANDIGTLNGGLYVRYKLKDKFGVRLSYHTLFTELKTTQKVQTNPIQNDRFRHGSNPIGFGFTYAL